jgi:hypothetical protein
VHAPERAGQRRKERKMEQATTTAAGRVIRKGIIAALLMALATALAAYHASPARAQEEAAQPSPDDTATLSFELTVKGDPPEGTTFLGFIPAEGGIRVPLTDPDGDGVYTGSTTLDRFGPGPRPVPPGTEPVSLPVQIAQESGGTIEVIRDFGVVPLDGDKTFTARVNFKRDRGETTTPEDNTPAPPDSGSGGSGGGSGLAAPENGVDLNADGVTDQADGEVAAATSDAAMKAQQASGGRALPATGGVSFMLLLTGVAGLFLTAGGLLVRRLPR